MIDQVYRLAQEILNKNGRGIISPARFLSVASNAQTKIICNAIDEYVQAKRSKDVILSDEKLRLMQDVIDKFSETKELTRVESGAVKEYHVMPTDYMMWGRCTVDDTEITKVLSRDKSVIKRNYFVSPSDSEPVCYLEGHKLYILPTTIGVIRDGNTDVAYDEVELSYYRYPKAPNWTYVTVSGKSVFNPSDPNYQDFEIPESLQNRLVIEVLKDFGMHIRDEAMFQYTNTEDNKEYQRDNR